MRCLKEGRGALCRKPRRGGDGVRHVYVLMLLDTPHVFILHQYVNGEAF